MQKIIFMGTPDFAVPTLKALIENYNVVLVVTEPDKVQGRKKEVIYSPVKQVAIENNIKVYQPNKIKLEKDIILNTEADIIVTCAYGQIIPLDILEHPKYGAVNVHPSLLPELRGGAPLERAIMNGLTKTGVTTYKMAAGMDDGDIIKQITYEIKPYETYGTLSMVLSIMGRNLLLETLDLIFNNESNLIKQDESKVTFAPIIKREDELIMFDKEGQIIDCQVRGLNPKPYAYFLLNKQEIKVIKGHFEEKESIINKVYIDKKSLGIGCLNGIYYLDIIKPSGKKEMEIKDYLNGLNKNIEYEVNNE